MNPDPRLAGQLRQAIEVDGDRLDDLHLWRVGPGHLAAIVSVVTRNPHDPSYYRDRLSRFKILSHLTVEVVPRNVA
jgi:Co/Zn/Cd efflux system component